MQHTNIFHLQGFVAICKCAFFAFVFAKAMMYREALFSTSVFFQYKNYFTVTITGVAGNFDWEGLKMEKSCDVSLVMFFSVLITMKSRHN